MTVAEPVTLGVIREMTADLPDDTPVVVLAPVGENDFRPVAFDVSTGGWAAQSFFIDLEEWG